MLRERQQKVGQKAGTNQQTGQEKSTKKHRLRQDVGVNEVDVGTLSQNGYVFISLSLSLSHSLLPSLYFAVSYQPLQMEGENGSEWKAEVEKKHRFHCFAAQDTRRRSKTVITQEDVTNGEVRSSPSRAFSLLALFFFCALVRRGYSRATPCFLFSVLIHEHQEV